ncbi:uncharacterized protein LOC124118047 [Haliotis rufescens]|uniref:uncharacterized protein LOC124118032 n=1 Tax=Haliotis rufescens TaxID=6454 RepID=UPI001EAFC171|nr:uncharacterized protein LOC124118032 [Haliotis rufescens]XP_048253116.1 uncharacterized protein LOC124118032 [Haliotis rufescens]XP_048253117.1 uncharacterized protein LOC124118047 [Haliotis rufescens]XP_048253118.1 uncharacterized protein LOC124118047 [Haliotis rufescens]
MNFSAIYIAVAFAFLIGEATMAPSGEEDALQTGKSTFPLVHFCKTVNDMGYSKAEKTLKDAVNALGKYKETNTEAAMETVLQMLAVSHIKYCNEVEAAKKGN